MKLVLFSLLLPVQLFAQTGSQRQELDTRAAYEKALTEYVQAHPDVVATSKSGPVVFVKTPSFIDGLSDTLAGVMLRMVDPSTDLHALNDLFPKKKVRLTLLDMQKMVSRAAMNYIWVIPMKTAWNGHKNKLKAPEYEDSFCEYVYDVHVQQGNISYLFKETKCK